MQITAGLERDSAFLADRVVFCAARVRSHELAMGIAERWQIDDPRYIETVKYMHTRKYHRALDKLQFLVVQRLFELQRLNVAGTGKSLVF